MFTGWQPQNFYTDFVRQYPPIPAGSSAERAVFGADGVFVECPHDVCNGVEYEDGFFRAMRIARQTDQRFVWLASRLPGQPRSGWLSEFQTMYNRVSAEGLWATRRHHRGDLLLRRVPDRARDPQRRLGRHHHRDHALGTEPVNRQPSKR